MVADDGAQERRQAVLDGLAERAAELNGTFDDRDDRDDDAAPLDRGSAASRRPLDR